MTILFISMAVFLLIGVPIGGAIGGAIVLMNLLEPFTTMEYLTQYMYSGVNSFTLLSLPFFIICGSLMDTGGLSKRLINIANSGRFAADRSIAEYAQNIWRVKTNFAF